MTIYTPYSLRHNITDPDLAGLLDYLERVMGWEICMTSPGMFRKEFFNYSCKNICISIGATGHIEVYHVLGSLLLDCSEDIFFRTYKTLLPVIRDLYSK